MTRRDRLIVRALAVVVVAVLLSLDDQVFQAIGALALVGYATGELRGWR